LAAPPDAKWHPGHYVLVGTGQIGPEHLDGHFRDVQKLHTRSDLEPASGHYDLSRS
jgi:hypothetical protein